MALKGRWLLHYLLLASTISIVKESSSKSAPGTRSITVSVPVTQHFLLHAKTHHSQNHYLWKNFIGNASSFSTGGCGGNQQRVKESSIVQYIRDLRLNPLPLGVGFAVLAVLQWRHIRRRERHGKEDVVAKDWEITCYQMVPLRALSRSWGWLLNQEIPEWARPMLYSWYIRYFGVNMSEAETENLSSYSSLGEFFRRNLRPGIRPVAASDCVVSPADGMVLEFGPVTSCQVQQVKGVKYSLPVFLGPASWPQGKNSEKEPYESCLLTKKENCLYQCVIYLAPGDYHRFHSPADWSVTFRRHFSGELFSVNPAIASWIPNLFSLNERAVYVGKWKHGFFSLTAVGATNVGSIRVYCDKELHTNERKCKKNFHKDAFLCCPNGIPFKKGDPFGEFNLGSTIVLLFEAPKNLRFKVKRNQKIHFGEALSFSVEDSQEYSRSTG